jgi:hypothetical protein
VFGRFLPRIVFCLVPVALAAVALGAPTAAPDNGAQDSAVGPGQFIFPCATGEETDSLSAHVPTGRAVTPGTGQPAAGGTFNASIPQSTAAACGVTASHLVAKFDCLRVSPGSPQGLADLAAHVMDASGLYAGIGAEISVSVSDTGESGAPDGEVFAHTSGPCIFSSSGFPKFLVNHGNFNIRSGG